MAVLRWTDMPGCEAGERQISADTVITIGRNESNEICVPSGSLSGDHCRVYAAEDGCYYVEDLESSNGTFHNGAEVPSAVLSDGDCIACADVEFTFVLEPVAENDEVAPTAEPQVAPIVEPTVDPEVETVAEPEVAPVAEPVVETPTEEPATNAKPGLSKFPLDLSPSREVAEDDSKFEDELTEQTLELVAELAATRKRLLDEIGTVIVGQKDVLDLILTALFAGGHCLMTGVPGLAKTLMVSSLSKSLSLDFKRIQFTPDLMPTDITGTMVLAEGHSAQRSFIFQSGPVFTNILLADEINRTPPKTQAALLEAMQERKVTVGGTTHKLPQPFLVLATQNPIEQEGTYTLPEAQLDRFLFLVQVDYPSLDEEQEILIRTTMDSMPSLSSVISGEQILQFQKLVRRVPVSPYVANYAARLARATRPGDALAPDFVPKWVQWGCGPRAGQSLLLAAKAHVLLNGRFNVSVNDIRHFVHPVFRHRFGLNFTAASEGYSTDDVIDWLIEAVPVIYDEKDAKATLMNKLWDGLRRKKKAGVK